VIARDGLVVGEGWHEKAGEPHAEIHALHAAGEAARGATVYLTLEPCAHHGRTPPCCEALVKAGPSRVVVAASDPNPRVNGQGLAALKAAGIATELGLFREQSESQNPGFFKRMRSGLPWVRLKVAASLDGRTAMASGESKWISGELAREDVQRWRARSSAVLTGIGTVLDDDPSLNQRLPGVQRQPMRVVLDTDLRLPASARILAQPGRVMVFTASDRNSDALRDAGASVHRVDSQAGGVALEPVLRELAAQEVNEVLVEAGSRLSGSFLACRLVDELIVYLAPSVLGHEARGMFTLPGITSLSERVQLRFCQVTQLGEDVRVLARPSPRD
jgi:diaminohydroxyphosphoribosylaminopyrimidine deaminase/5-amino-6-(5-phosphoribosylamino)uracil reductase